MLSRYSMLKERTTARDIALEVLYQTEYYKRQVNLILHKTFQSSDLSSRDKRLIHELVYGVLRWRERLDWMINRFSRIPLARMPLRIRNILRMAMYQLSFTDKIPAWASVHEAVIQAGHYGHRGTKALVNAILREYLRSPGAITYPDLHRDPLAHLRTVYSHPQRLVERWISRYGIDTARKICDYNNKIPLLSLRVNTLLISRIALKEYLEAEGISVVLGAFAPECLKIESHIELRQAPFFQKGLCQVQDEASILISYLLTPQKGERILDACAAPGGKATHIAQLIEDDGEIIAIDNNRYRLEQLKDNYQRLKITCIKPFLQDACQIPASWGEFDRILVDAPCSGLGVIRRHPEIKWLKREEELDSYRSKQLAILNGVKGCLKQGGVLIYSVCSLEPEETINVVRQYLADNPGFSIDRVDGHFPWLDPDGFFWSLPALSHEMDGLFAVRLKKG